MFITNKEKNRKHFNTAKCIEKMQISVYTWFLPQKVISNLLSSHPYVLFCNWDGLQDLIILCKRQTDFFYFSCPTKGQRLSCVKHF